MAFSSSLHMAVLGVGIKMPDWALDVEGGILGDEGRNDETSLVLWRQLLSAELVRRSGGCCDYGSMAIGGGEGKELLDLSRPQQRHALCRRSAERAPRASPRAGIKAAIH